MGLYFGEKITWFLETSSTAKTASRPHGQCFQITIWRFPKVDVPGTLKSSVVFSDFPWNKPSSYWDTPSHWETFILQKILNFLTRILKNYECRKLHGIKLCMMDFHGFSEMKHLMSRTGMIKHCEVCWKSSGRVPTACQESKTFMDGE